MSGAAGAGATHLFTEDRRKEFSEFLDTDLTHQTINGERTAIEPGTISDYRMFRLIRKSMFQASRKALEGHDQASVEAAMKKIFGTQYCSRTASVSTDASLPSYKAVENVKALIAFPGELIQKHCLNEDESPSLNTAFSLNEALATSDLERLLIQAFKEEYAALLAPLLEKNARVWGGFIEPLLSKIDLADGEMESLKRATKCYLTSAFAISVHRYTVFSDMAPISELIDRLPQLIRLMPDLSRDPSLLRNLDWTVPSSEKGHELGFSLSRMFDFLVVAMYRIFDTHIKPMRIKYDNPGVSRADALKVADYLNSEAGYENFLPVLHRLMKGYYMLNALESSQTDKELCASAVLWSSSFLILRYAGRFYMKEASRAKEAGNHGLMCEHMENAEHNYRVALDFYDSIVPYFKHHKNSLDRELDPLRVVADTRAQLALLRAQMMDARVRTSDKPLGFHKNKGGYREVTPEELVDDILGFKRGARGISTSPARFFPSLLVFVVKHRIASGMTPHECKAELLACQRALHNSYRKYSGLTNEELSSYVEHGLPKEARYSGDRKVRVKSAIEHSKLLKKAVDEALPLIEQERVRRAAPALVAGVPPMPLGGLPPAATAAATFGMSVPHQAASSPLALPGTVRYSMQQVHRGSEYAAVADDGGRAGGARKGRRLDHVGTSPMNVPPSTPALGPRDTSSPFFAAGTAGSIGVVTATPTTQP